MDIVTDLLGRPAGPWIWGQLLLAFAFIVGALVVRAVVNGVIRGRLQRLAARTATAADDRLTEALVSPLSLVLPVAGVYGAVHVLLAVQEQWRANADATFRVLTIALLAWTAFRIADALAVFLTELTARTESRMDDHLVPLVRKAAKTFTVVLAFILVAQNLGYSVSGLLAGLGIGGLALAMAAKDTLANLFGSIMILVDRPFRVGDWVTFDGGDGVVEEIGLRSTRVRTFAKTVVSIPNQALANATIENHSLMPKRRIKFTLGVTYDASAGQMRTLVERIEGYLRGHEEIDQEFMLVKFTEFGSSSLDVFVYCFTRTTDWTRHLAVRQEVNLALMEMVQEMGLSVAFPTRTVHLVGAEAQA
ncbi:MAG: mechanosensitive ion channel family protein [Candidatus Krumholzibacteriia bacterium]